MRATITPELIEELARHFPDRAPTPGTSIERVWFDAGGAAVVRFLQGQLAEQIEAERGYSDQLEA